MNSIECACCWDYNEDLLVCNEGHFACKECISRGINVAIGDKKVLCCFAENCKSNYPDYVIKLSIKDIKIIDAYFDIVLMDSLDLQDNIYSCPFCINRVVIDTNEETIFYCMNGCKNYSCMKCNTKSHDGQCNLTDKQRQDELETEEYVIKCCNNVFIRGDACNRVHCPKCNIAFCWICKEKGVEYTHFGMQHERKVTLGRQCHLYGERGQSFLQPQQLNYQERVQPQIQQQPQIQPQVMILNKYTNRLIMVGGVAHKKMLKRQALEGVN